MVDMEEGFNVTEKEHKIDMISELPDTLLQQILCFLPTKQVVQSGILSRRWKHVWFTVPVLEFDQTCFESKLWCRDRKKTRQIQRKRVELYHCVEQNLLSHCRQGLKINKFTLFMKLTTRKSVSRLDRWIDYAVKGGIEELNLEFYRSLCKRYILPQRVLLAKSITVLTLRGCRLESLYCDINLPSLQKLSLSEVHTNDQIIHNLVAGCPLIEDMGLESCYGLKNIHFSALSKLMAIKLRYNILKKVELEASNLYDAYIQENEACDINLINCKNLKKLELYTECMTDEWFHYHISQLAHIEKLIIHCNMLEKIKISSQSLKALFLLKCDKLVEVKIDTPKLCLLSYCGHSKISLSLNASVYLSEACYQMVRPVDHWDVQKIELLSKLSNSKVLYLTGFYVAKDVVVPKELRDTLPSPSYNVKQLKVAIYQPWNGHEIDRLVDNLLWISPLPEIVVITCWINVKPWKDTTSFKFSYKKPILDEENPSCCKFLPNPCWRHCLKTVTIENIRERADEETLKAEKETLEKYFYENAKFLESFLFLCGGVG
ncbi:putative f-box/lrr-repeat protein [Quercus suber]|uniref:F-box/lrr-repeat protein n=1 Tax=Quercus suber TaxID=58331 RepID=A0AAW0M3T3_QUESU